MATGTVLSATFMEGKQGRRSCFGREPLLYSSRPISWCPLHCMQEEHADAGPLRRTSSRRDSIALFLPIALLCAPRNNADAHAAEGVHLKEELKMEDLCHDSPGKRLMSNLCLGEFSGFVLANLGALKTSGSSLGFLGCLVFGLLFLREKQANAANATSLEDVQLRIQKAEIELSLQTRSSIVYKLEESQLAIGSERDISLHDAVQCQLFTVKSSNVEKGQKLTENKHISETLKQQVMSLTASVDEERKYCSSLMGNVDHQYCLRQRLEVVVQSVEANLQSTAEAMGKLKVATEDQEQASNKLVEENVVVESSLDLLNKKVLGLQAEFESLKDSLCLSNSTGGFLSKELNIAATRNAALEAKFNELLRSLQHERASFEKLVIEHNELLIFSRKRADVCFTALLIQQDELDKESRTASQLTIEQDVLDKALREKKSTLENVRKASCLDLERLRILENELLTLHQQLQQERARNVDLQSACKDNTVIRELLKVSAELKGQINIEKKLAERLDKELHVSQEALSLLGTEVLDLQDSMQSRLSSQVHLQVDLTRLNEVKRAHCQALKKEKRAAAYARRQLTLTTKTLTEESQVMEELRKELENVRKLTEYSKLQIASQANQLEKDTNTVACLWDNIIALRAVLQEKQTRQLNFSGSDEVPTCAAKPSRRRNLSNPAVPKLRSNSS